MYDYQPIPKVGCFLILFALVYWLRQQKENCVIPDRPYLVEVILLAAVFVYILIFSFSNYFPWLHVPPRMDTGVYTQEAVFTFFNELQNPYQSETMFIYNQDPSFGGYKHGPMMFFGYFLSTLLPESGFKIMNLLYLGLTSILIFMITRGKEEVSWKNAATISFILAVWFVQGRLWFELFTQGTNDIFPVFLVMAAFWLIKRESLFLAGVVAGLSFSAKFVPAAFLIFLFLRKKIQWSFFYGVLVGLVPIVFFLLWDANAFIQNAVVFHIIKKYDTTSLYSVVPAGLHFLFQLAQATAILFMIAMNYNKKVEYKSLTGQFVLLLILVEIFYKEIHNNHLLFFMPFTALIFGWSRYQFLLWPFRGQEEA